MEEGLVQLLENIGLTKQESNAYISLYELKEAKAGELSSKSKIATANLYPVLDSLIKKGLVSYRMLNNTKIFCPASPEAFNELIENKQKALDNQKIKVKQAIQELKQTGQEVETISGYKYFEGLSGIKSLWNEILGYMSKFNKNSTLNIYSAPKQDVENLRGFYNDFHKARLKLNQGYRLIADNQDKEIVALRAKQKNTQVKLIDLKNEASWGIFEDCFFITHQVGKKPVGFLIKDTKIAKTFEQTFNTIWNKI